MASMVSSSAAANASRVPSLSPSPSLSSSSSSSPRALFPTPYHWSPTPGRDQPIEMGLEPEHESQRSLQVEPARSQLGRRIRYTPEVKLQLMRLCIDNGARYLETTSEKEFWEFIRVRFASIMGPRSTDSAYSGDSIRKKVTSIIMERKAELATRELLSGVAIPATSDLEQAIDTWIELVDRRMEEKRQKLGEKGQVKLEKEMASIRRENLSKTLSQKRTYQEVAREVVDLTDSSQSQAKVSSTEIKRDKRRKIGKGWARGRQMEADELDRNKITAFFDSVQSMMKETLELFRTGITSTPNTSIPPPNPLAPPPNPLAPPPNFSAPPLNSSVPSPNLHNLLIQLHYPKLD
ncbi:hypothetical protein BDZ91DRAFT_746189 [Kalaharituber pfeilii]|nr:hypothetical protein BDZ91DRAFT_746189 [Kalaharituber pfeilii]